MIKLDCLKGIGKTKKEFNRQFRGTGNKTFNKYCKKSKDKKREFIVKGKDGYRKYLKTKHWKNTRTEYFKRNLHSCYCCFDDATQLHHVNYSRLWQELDKDLVPLCDSCHKGIHDFIKENGFKLKDAHILYKTMLHSQKILNELDNTLYCARAHK